MANLGTISAVLAVLPTIALFIYIYKHDKADKEPFGLLLKLFIGGATLTVASALILERSLSPLISSVDNKILNAFLEAFCSAAFCEELCKLIVLYLFTHKNKNFNSLFDGVIYAVCVSLGFATLENILYVFGDGVTSESLSTAITRAVYSVPGHCFFAVFMGYYYSLYHVYKKAAAAEKHYADMGVTTVLGSFKYKDKFCLTFVAPFLLHGFYDFCLMANIAILGIVFDIFVVALYVRSFKRIKAFSKMDKLDHQYIAALLVEKHPELYNYLYKVVEPQPAPVPQPATATTTQQPVYQAPVAPQPTYQPASAPADTTQPTDTYSTTTQE